MKANVYISTVADGSMYNRHDKLDASVIKNREVYLTARNIAATNTIRVNPDANRRAEVDHETDWCRYAEVNATNGGSGMYDGNAPATDALTTKQKDLAILLPVADCVGVALFDPVNEVLMVSHLGRHSLEQQGGEKSVQHLVDTYGSNPEDLLVWLTPAPNKIVFPIWALDNKGMKEVTFEQLANAGILTGNITDNPADTVTDFNYFSYSEFLKGHRDEDGDHAIVAVMAI